MNFFADLIKRLFSKSPWFFRIVKWASIIVAIITGLPAFLTSAGIVLPIAIAAIASKTVMYAAFAGAFIAQLTQVEPTTHPTDVAEKLKQEDIKAKEGVI